MFSSKNRYNYFFGSRTNPTWNGSSGFKAVRIVPACGRICRWSWILVSCHSNERKVTSSREALHATDLYWKGKKPVEPTFRPKVQVKINHFVHPHRRDGTFGRFILSGIIADKELNDFNLIRLDKTTSSLFMARMKQMADCAKGTIYDSNSILDDFRFYNQNQIRVNHFRCYL